MSSSSSHDPWRDCFLSMQEGEDDLEFLFAAGFALADEYARRADEHPVTVPRRRVPDLSFIKQACSQLSEDIKVSPVHGKEEAVVLAHVSEGDRDVVAAWLTSRGVEVKSTKTTKMAPLRGWRGDWYAVYLLVSTKT